VGWNFPSGWSVDGPANFDLRWQNDGRLALREPTGEIDLLGISLHAPFLNQPVSALKGRLEFAGPSRELFVASAQAFGGEWTGRIDLSPASGGDHPFALTVDRLNAEDLDRWLNPHWRHGFFGNVLGFLGASSAAAVPEDLQGRGRLTVSQFAFSRFVIHGLDGELSVHARHLELEDATAEFAGAKISGGMVAEIGPKPAYTLRTYFSGLNLGLLEAGSPTFAEAVSGIASGELTMGFEGVGRSSLLGSMTCDGHTDIRNASLEGFDLVESLRGGTRVPGKSAFARATAAFTCRGGEILFSRMLLERPDAGFDAIGSVDLSRNIDFRVRGTTRLMDSNSPVRAAVPLNVFRVSGPLFAPEIARVQTTPRE
jgi:AsmA-like C-terminal region